jgi:hypothetical protein
MLTFFDRNATVNLRIAKLKALQNYLLFWRPPVENPEIQNSEYSSRKQLKVINGGKENLLAIWKPVPARINGRHQNS